MKEMTRKTVLRTAMLVAVAVAGSGLHVGSAAAQEKLTVFAAASLKNALDAVNAACQADVGERATVSYAASSALAKQVEQGAPADIFMSADLDWMKYLSDKNLTAKDTERQVLGNSIVLVAPADSAARTEIKANFDIAALVGSGKLAMANVDAVPAGKYGKAALEKLGVWASVSGKVAQAENVRAALALVSTGEAPVGIVYATDAVAHPKVKVIGTFPTDSHPAIIYPVAKLAGAKSAKVPAFLKCLENDKSAALFRKEGFTVVGK